MDLDLAAAAILLLLLAIGAFRGWIASLASLSTLVLAYVAAVLAARHAAPAVALRLDAPLLWVAPAVGTAAFVAGGLFVRTLSAPLLRWDRARARALGRSGLDRLLGGCVGAVRGAVVVVLLALLATWLDAARDLSGRAELAALPQTEASIAARVSSRAVEAAVAAAVGEGAAGDVAGRLLARPGVSLQAVQTLANDPSLRALQSDPRFWSDVEDGRAQEAARRPAFQALVENDELRRQLAALGAIDGEAASDAEAFEGALVATLESLGPRLRALREDPEVQALASDPRVRERLEAGDPWALLSDARLHHIATRVAEDL